MNTIRSRASAALASVLITLAVVAGIDALAGFGHADAHLTAAIDTGTAG